VKAVARLVAAYRQDGITDETVNVFVDRLSDIAPDLLRATVHQVLERSKFFPSIAELRETAARLAGLLPPTPAEAMAIVRRADVREPVSRRDGSVAYVERYWRWPEDVDPRALELIQGALAAVGEPCDQNGKAHFGWEMGFQNTFEERAEEITRTVLSDLSRARLVAPRGALAITEGGA